ncbi:phosphoribosylanthranilate isomerase [Verrucomicrobium sp. GAS474]|uniref:phosphoribosylanthranilate isomerase n=1 Tax=Verrucomicrobium sp. GAS474 TaxID=1882831 RepID=UPI00087BD148|nr:phosphoribosylanthranilate isomerase [Verrucomicrobium sp. GAS474]SDU14815.1 phosphoribosylanthranilate isomerase [Verrucomicrobium sp. GAS474]
MTRIKICGITRVEDAFSAIRWGADSIGFLVGQRHASPDFLTAEAAGSIIAKLPPLVNTVLVTHLLTADEVLDTLEMTGADTVQLHGEITPAEIIRLREWRPRLKIIKSFHVVDEACVEYGLPYVAFVDAFVLDSLNAETNQIGGTGLVHDWEISSRIKARYPIPIILAGGLTPENVADGIAAVRPYGVDVNTGLKNASGFKDHAKIHSFVEAVRGVHAMV